MESTEDLVNRVRQGEHDAFEALIERFRSRLLRQIEARMSLDLRSKVDSEDVLHETLLCAYESIGRLEWRGEETFYRWLASIAEHFIRNAARKKTPSLLCLSTEEFPSVDASPSDQLRRQDRFDRLEGALNNLSPDHRRALVLARIDGLRIKDIAQQMDRSMDAVKKLLSRALIELRRCFGETDSFHLPGQQLNVGGLDDDES